MMLLFDNAVLVPSKGANTPPQGVMFLWGYGVLYSELLLYIIALSDFNP